jgi:hypothetical protein
MRSASAVAILAVCGVGCTHTIQYKLTKDDRWTGPQVDKVLAVERFADETVPQTNRVVRIDRFDWRTNFRPMYKDKEIANGVSAMIAKHLERSGLFRKVTYGQDPATADLKLSGTIGQYWALARVNKGAELTQAAVAGFGLIGALLGSAATAGEKTLILAQVELRDVTLEEVSSGRVLWRDTIQSATDSTAYFGEASEPIVYKHADVCLKRAVSEMITKIAETLRSSASTISIPKPEQSSEAIPEAVEPEIPPETSGSD